MANFSFGSQVQQVVGSYKTDALELSSSERVKRAWNSSVDQRIAPHVTAVFVVPDTNASEVIVYVDDSIWATELSLQSEILRLKLNKQINEDLRAAQSESRAEEQVKKLRFNISKEKYVAKERRKTINDQLIEEDQAYRDIEPVELSDDEKSDLFTALIAIDNDDLRDIAYAAVKANLEWQKGIDRIGA